MSNRSAPRSRLGTVDLPEGFEAVSTGGEAVMGAPMEGLVASHSGAELELVMAFRGRPMENRADLRDFSRGPC